MTSLWIPTKVEFGNGAIDRLPALCRELGISRALIIGGASALGDGGAANRASVGLRNAGISFELAKPVPAEPDSDKVDEVAAFALETGVDGFIAFGGGSPIDVAKLAAAIHSNGGHAVDYESGSRTCGRHSAPLVAVPTTAGSGSEVSPYSVINNSETHRKFTVGHDHLRAAVAVVDPMLTHGLSKEQTLAGGLDAWIHVLEAHLTIGGNQLVTPWSRRASELIGGSLAIAADDPSNTEARQSMAEAALLGGMVIAHQRTGLIHTMSVSVAQFFPTPHGLLNAIISPHVLAYNLPFYAGRLATMAGWMFGSEWADKGDEAALEKIQEWMAELGVPTHLGQTLPDEDMFGRLIGRLRQDGGLPNVNPQPISDDHLLSLFANVIHGTS